MIKIMNPKLKEFLNNKRTEELIKRNEHLISLGLIDETKTIKKRTYHPNREYGFNLYDQEKKMFYREDVFYSAIEVTDEEYEQILKYAPIEKKVPNNKTTETDNETTETAVWSKRIRLVVNIILVIALAIGLISSLFIVAEYGLNKYSFSLLLPFVFLIIFALIELPFVFGYSKIVEAAEKFLGK